VIAKYVTKQYALFSSRVNFHFDKFFIVGRGLACHPVAGSESSPFMHKGEQLMLGTILLVFLILLLVGAFSGSRRWGYFPSGGLGLVVLIVVILLLAGRI
jgi:hypothetical protein